MVAATEQIDQFWKATDSAEFRVRFIGTYNGIMRVFPGTVSGSKGYNHNDRPW